MEGKSVSMLQKDISKFRYYNTKCRNSDMIIRYIDIPTYRNFYRSFRSVSAQQARSCQGTMEEQNTFDIIIITRYIEKSFDISIYISKRSMRRPTLPPADSLIYFEYRFSLLSVWSVDVHMPTRPIIVDATTRNSE